MGWEAVKVPTGSKGRTSPYASVGFGRLSLSVAACELIDDYNSFSYVQLYKDNEGNRLRIGVKFLKEANPNAIRISRKKTNGKIVGGIDISNREVLQSLFGIAATAKKATRYNVKKDEAMDNFIVIFAE